MSETYEQYHQRVVAEIRAHLTKDGPPRTDTEREQFERNIAFFDTECSYVDEYAEGVPADEVAVSQIESV